MGTGVRLLVKNPVVGQAADKNAEQGGRKGWLRVLVNAENRRGRNGGW